MHSANNQQITFLSDSRYSDKLADCQAAAVVLTAKDLEACKVAAWITHTLLMHAWLKLWIQRQAQLKISMHQR